MRERKRIVVAMRVGISSDSNVIATAKGPRR